MRIEKLRQTVFINMEDKNLIIFSFPESEYTPGSRFNIKISVGDRLIFDEECFDRINKVFLPLVQKDTKACIAVYQEGEKPVKHYFVLKPVKKWTFSFITSSHEDLGYCAWANKLGSECADYTDAALDIMDRDSRYKYMIEHYWWLDGFNKYRTSEQKSRLRKYLKSGNMELNAPIVSNHTHWQSEELLLRSLYPSQRTASVEYDIVPKTAVYADLAGMTWGAVNAYVNAGLKYAIIAENRYLRFTTDDEELPQLFWWEAPNGKDRLLCMHQNNYRPDELGPVICDTLRQYREGEFIFDTTKINNTVLAVDSMIEHLGDIEYDLYPCVFYDDHEFPTTMLLKVCDGLNDMWKYPKFNMATPTECLSYIEKNFGETLPVKKGDWSEQWADFATIAPMWFSKMREAQRLLPIAETMSVISAIKDGKPYPRQIIDEAIWRICEFDDHCWATSSKHPQEMHKFNLALVKKESADLAHKNLCNVIEKCARLYSEDEWLEIWNLLPQNRKTSFLVNENSVPENLICQKLPDGRIITEPVDLPSCGYKFFKKDKSNKICKSAELNTSAFETPFYAVQCDLETQEILSIIDKQTGEELIDNTSEYGFCEFLYINTETKHGKGYSVEHQQSRTFNIYKGELATVIVITAFEEQIGANISVSITFYEKEKNIDIECEFKNATGLMGDYYDRYKKNIFWAFPLRVTGHHFCTELAGAIVDERSQRLPNNPHDFVCANNWVAVQNENGGIALLSKDMPIFHLGDIHYNEISAKVDFSTSSNIFLYAASNRTNNLNFTSKDDCRGSYRISLLPYEGNCSENVPFWCDNKNQIPIVSSSDVFKDEFSFINIDADNVRLSTCKLSETDNSKVILRFIETAGRRTVAKLKLPSEVCSVSYANGIEFENENRLPVDCGAVDFEIDAFSYVTLSLNLKLNNEISVESNSNKLIKNIFTFELEAKNTLVCFEKCDLKSIENIEIYADGILADTLKPDDYYIQFAIIPIVNAECLEIRVHSVTGQKDSYFYETSVF